jgi:hypothetical protein
VDTVSVAPRLRPSERQLIEMEKARIAAELRQLKVDFLTRQEARRCSAA